MISLPVVSCYRRVQSCLGVSIVDIVCFLHHLQCGLDLETAIRRAVLHLVLGSAPLSL